MSEFTPPLSSAIIFTCEKKRRPQASTDYSSTLARGQLNDFQLDPLHGVKMHNIRELIAAFIMKQWVKDGGLVLAIGPQREREAGRTAADFELANGNSETRDN